MTVEFICEKEDGNIQSITINFDITSNDIRWTVGEMAKNGFWKENVFYPPQRIYKAKIWE